MPHASFFEMVSFPRSSEASCKHCCGFMLLHFASHIQLLISVSVSDRTQNALNESVYTHKMWASLDNSNYTMLYGIEDAVIEST